MNAVLAMVEAVALLVIVPTIVVLLVQRRVRRQKQRALDQAVAEATRLCDERTELRRQAEADGAEAAFVSPGYREIDAILAEIFPRSDR